MSRAQPKLGQRVQVVTGNGNVKNGKQLCGRVAYVGRTSFAGGQWFGVVLDEPRGKNNGSVQGSTYFKCAPNCGLFVRGQQLQLLLGGGGGGAEQEKQQLLRKQNEQSNRNHEKIDNDNMQRDVSKVRLASRGRSRSSRQASEEQVNQTHILIYFLLIRISFCIRMHQGRPQHRLGEVQKSWQRRPRFH